MLKVYRNHFHTPFSLTLKPFALILSEIYTW